MSEEVRIHMTPIGVVVQTEDGLLYGEDGNELSDEEWELVDPLLQHAELLEAQDEIAEYNGVYLDPSTREYADFLGREYDMDQDDVFVNHIQMPDLNDRDTRRSQLQGMVEESQGYADAQQEAEDYFDDAQARLGDARDTAERREDLAYEIRDQMDANDEWGREEEANWRDRQG